MTPYILCLQHYCTCVSNLSSVKLVGMSYQLKIVYIGIYYLLDCDYLEQYEVELTALLFIIYEDRLIPVDILGHFNKIVGNIINLKQVERITCKNVFFAVVA